MHLSSKSICLETSKDTVDEIPVDVRQAAQVLGSRFLDLSVTLIIDFYIIYTVRIERCSDI